MLVPTASIFVIEFATVSISATASVKSFSYCNYFRNIFATVFTEAILLATVVTLALLEAKVPKSEIPPSVVMLALSEVDNQVFSK